MSTARQPSEAARQPRVILAGNSDQAQDFIREHGWSRGECIVVDAPEDLRGVRGPVEVHRVGSYFHRDVDFIDAVEQAIDTIREVGVHGDPLGYEESDR